MNLSSKNQFNISGVSAILRLPDNFLFLKKNDTVFSHLKGMEQINYIKKNKNAIFTYKKQYATIAYIARRTSLKAAVNRRLLNNQRYILKSVKQCSEAELALVMRDFFPGIIFIPKNSGSNLAVSRYVIKKNDGWTLDIAAMSRSNEKYFASLYPDDISSWDEKKAREMFDCADIIKFFVNIENDKFVAEFSKNNYDITGLISDEIPKQFFNKLKDSDKNYGAKPVWENWDFSGIIVHKLRHDPPKIYEAFNYFAHREYTRLRLALTKLITENSDIRKKYNFSELLRNGRQILDNNISIQFPDLTKYSVEYQIAFFELVQEILEGTPAGQSIYSSTEMEVLLKQIKSRSFSLNKKNNDVNYIDSFNQSERKTINNHIIKISQFIKDTDNKKYLNNLKLEGSYRDKINFLHKSFMLPDVRKHYSRRELDIIHGLFLKQFYTVSLDTPLNEGDDETVLNGYDVTETKDYLNPEEKLIWTSFFKDVFKYEFDECNLEKFLDCIPGHFDQFPFCIETDGSYNMSKYSKKMLFSTFCEVAGIPNDYALWKQFLVLLKEVINNINRSIK